MKRRVTCCVTVTAPSAQPTPSAFGPWRSAIIRQHRAHPDTNGHVERLIGSIRRENLDHLLVFDEAQLRRVLNNYAAYYNQVRIHLSLARVPWICVARKGSAHRQHFNSR